MLRKKGTFNFFVFFTEVSQNFLVGNEAQVTRYSKSVSFFAPSKRVGGWGLGAKVRSEEQQYGLCLGAART